MTFAFGSDVRAAMRSAGAIARGVVAAVHKAIAARTMSPLRLVACRPLQAGGALYVADIDGRRLIFVAGHHACCLLSQYDAPQPAEGTARAARLKAHAEC